MRTADENRALLRQKAKFIRTQKHFDAVMELFPPEMRAEVFREMTPLLKTPVVDGVPAPFVLKDAPAG